MRSTLILCAFVCGTALCAAQSSAPSAESAPPAKTAPDEVTQPAQNPPAQAEPAPAPASPPEPVPAPEPAAAPPAAANALPPARKTPADPKTSQEVKGAYVLGPLDVISVSVWGQNNLSKLYDIGPDGLLPVPLIGEIKADGLTIAQLKAVLTEKLSDFLNQPEVTVSLVKVNSKSYLIVGGVGRPGKFTLNEKTTVLDAIVGAGGMKDFAKTKKIYILRGKTKFLFNYKDVIQGKNPEQNIELQNGDQIVVPE